MSLSRILLVDDSSSSIDSLHLFFELEGFDVKTARNGEEGLSRTREFLPQLVLMDLRMPVMDGYETAREIRKLPLDIQPVLVALSGLERDQIHEKVQEAGFDKLLIKPVSPDSIRELLAEF